MVRVEMRDDEAGDGTSAERGSPDGLELRLNGFAAEARNGKGELMRRSPGATVSNSGSSRKASA
jgi:hypothetical protein